MSLLWPWEWHTIIIVDNFRGVKFSQIVKTDFRGVKFSWMASDIVTALHQLEHNYIISRG